MFFMPLGLILLTSGHENWVTVHLIRINGESWEDNVIWLKINITKYFVGVEEDCGASHLKTNKQTKTTVSLQFSTSACS